MRIPANKVLEFKNAHKLSGKASSFVDKMVEANIPIDYWMLTMSKFQGSDTIKDAVNAYIWDIKNNYNLGKGFTLAGSYGIGKTYGLCSILKTALRLNYTAYYTSLPSLSSYGMSYDYKDEYFKMCTKSDFLVFDEADARHISTSDEAKTLFGSLIERILRERVQNSLPTFFGTNHDSISPLFVGQHARAIESLLALKNTTINALGQDFRKRKPE